MEGESHQEPKSWLSRSAPRARRRAPGATSKTSPLAAALFNALPADDGGVDDDVDDSTFSTLFEQDVRFATTLFATLIPVVRSLLPHTHWRSRYAARR